MRSERLQRIIELKERLMEEKERLLDQHNRELALIKSNIDNLDCSINSNYNELCTRPLNGNEFSVIKNYLEYLNQARSNALTQLGRMEAKIAAVRQELYDLLKEMKMLDALKQRTLSAARKVDNRKQQKHLDEIALRLSSHKP